MRTFRTCAFAVCLMGLAWIYPAPMSAQTSPVSIQFQNGRVSLKAQNATVRVILQEWARVGKTRIVDGDRVTGSPLTIELNNVPEQQALATILRGVSGYMVGARENLSTGPSSFDRIMIMPTSVNAAAAGRTPAPTAPPPAPIAFVPGEPDDANDLPPDAAGRALTAAQLQNQINARAAAQRNPENAASQPPPAPASTPGTVPGFSGRGGSRPGEITPVPQRNPLRPNGDPEP